jgi:hypothetical protein
VKLTTEQSHELLNRFGVYVTEACDKCTKLLGPVRFTRKDEAVEWCSRECRGDAREAIRKGGRPRKYRNAVEARSAKTKQQQLYRTSPGVEKTPLQLRRNKGLADAKMASLVVGPNPPICGKNSCLETA